jgi:L-alanine-DL-glutamate epimerase-like enolase superfamily enzyme
MLRDIIRNPVEMDHNGKMKVPQNPGLGILMDEKAVNRYRIN